MKNFILVGSIILFMLTSILAQQKVGNYNVYPPGKWQTIDAFTAIEKANTDFEKYVRQETRSIALLASIEDNDFELRELKLSEKIPQTYLCLPRSLQSRKDTIAVVKKFKESLYKETLVAYDSLGNILDFKTNFEFVPFKEDAKPKSSSSVHSNYFLRPLDMHDHKKVQDLAMHSYEKNNKVVTGDLYYLSFLWSNIYYHYYEMTEDQKSSRFDIWSLYIPLADIANMRPEDFSIKTRKYSTKLRFLKAEHHDLYEVVDDGQAKIVIPKLGFETSYRWAFLSFNIHEQFAKDNELFYYSTLYTIFLKSKYGPNVIKDMMRYYKENGKGTMFFASFLNSEYNANTNWKKMTSEFDAWIIKNQY